jgi:hypothetical protein
VHPEVTNDIKWGVIRYDIGVWFTRFLWPRMLVMGLGYYL